MITMQQKIFNYLVDFIERDNIKPGEKMPAESELCTRFKASRNTVRKAYDELVHTGYVIRKPGLGSFVKERSSSVKSLSIGVIVPGMDVFDEITDPVAGHLKFDIFNGILQRAHEINAKINIVPTPENWTPDQEMDGYLLLYYDNNILNQLRNLAVPCVSTLLGGTVEGISGVTTNLYNSFVACFEYLIKKGHRNIGLIDNIKLPSYPAYNKVMHKYSLPCDDSYIERFEKGFDDSGKDSFIKLMDKSPELDAVFFRTDITAISALDYCRETGIKVPEDLSIMGFDNNVNSNENAHNLTTFDTMRKTKGYKALKKLEQLIIDPALPIEIETVEGEVIERGTVADIRK